MTVPRTLLFLLVVLLPALLALSCANQIPPDGGPVDTVPPKIVSTFPPPYTTHFSGDHIDLEFDKYVDRRSVEESIFISPYVGKLEFDWSGKEIEISFTEQLRKNRTYVANIGTDVVDLRNHNRMAQAFTLAFSTGDVIDRGAIGGRVYPIRPSDPPEGVMIFAYQLADMDPDTLNPQTLKPDYITQTGSNGDFLLQHLGFGAYRIFAVRDQYRNLLYDPEADDFGVTAHDLVLSIADSLHTGITMQLTKDDTTAPRLLKVDPADVNHLQVEFSEPLDTSSSAPVIVSAIDTLTREQLEVFSVYSNPMKPVSYTVVTGKQDSTQIYVLTVEQARDIVGIPISPKANSLTFVGASKTDSLLPRITSVSISDSARGIRLRPVIQVQFSDAVERASLDSAVSFTNASGGNVPMTIDWLSDVLLAVKTQNVLASNAWYRLTLRTYAGKDWAGRSFCDSARVVRFETLDQEALSSIEGIVVDDDPAHSAGPIIVAADVVDAKTPTSYSSVARATGSFAIVGLEEGRYVVRAFRDRNSNATLDCGKPFPFVRSERFGYAPDTLKVRARWPLEGVRIELR
jgi:hypothetical protein